MSFEEQDRLERDEPWSLEGWLYWMEPINRFWFWWEACATRDDHAVVAVEVTEWPFPWKALSWLLRAAGATSVGAEGDD